MRGVTAVPLPSWVACPIRTPSRSTETPGEAGLERVRAVRIEEGSPSTSEKVTSQRRLGAKAKELRMMMQVSESTMEMTNSQV